MEREQTTIRLSAELKERIQSTSILERIFAMNKKKTHITCPICGNESYPSAEQCRRCGTMFDLRKPFSKFIANLRVFKRLRELELKSKQQAAVMMKLCKEDSFFTEKKQ